MAVEPTPSAPPQSHFKVWQRLLRGYGPLVAFAALIALISIAVPSTVQKGAAGQTAASNGTPSYSTGPAATPGSATQPTTPSGVPASNGTTGTPGSTSSKTVTSGGTAPQTPGVVSQCGGSTPQVGGDPYSPPCINFTGSNGGATSVGVTATTITISYRVTSDKSFQQTLAQLAGASLEDTQADVQRTINALADYFNAHFQFYGRKLVIKYYNGQGSLTSELLGQGQAQAEADATTVATSIHSFGDLSAESEPYADSLKRLGVMGFGDPYMSQQWHEEHAPYDWSTAADGTKVASFAAEYLGKKLCPAGSPAAYAGGNLKGKPRKFATLAPDNSWYQESVQVARKVISSYNCDPGENIAYQLDLGTMPNQATNIITKLQSDGVTTILCGCDPIIPVFLSGVANREGYYPEFIITGTALTDADIVGQLWNQQFAAHAFGISPNEQTVASTSTLGYAAYKAERQDEPAFVVDLIYAQMDMLAIGIQMAGPDLTPANFEKGMQAYPPKVGPNGLWDFAAGNFTIGEDVREICWSPTSISTYNQKAGAYLGTSDNRWTQGKIPTGPPGCPIPSS